MIARKILAVLLALCLGAVLASCGGGEPVETGLDPLQIAGTVLASQEEAPEMRVLAMGEEEFAAYLANYYAVDAELLEDGIICYAGGADAGEIAVLALAPDADAARVEELLLDYIEHRIGEFFGYLPDQVRLLEQAAVVTRGNVVALLICPEPERARAAFEDCFREGEGLQAGGSLTLTGLTAGEAPLQDGTGDPCDPGAVAEAWRTGDHSRLNRKERIVLEVCALVLEQVVDEAMSDYEKELAVHDWIIEWADYDTETMNHTPGAQPHPDNDNPFGLLIGRRAICTGYTGTFQLFMDLLEIECLTVRGYANDALNDHAWNMVRLEDGQWYCVDVTWNDPYGLEEDDQELRHNYFNVTSQYLRETKHFWDESAVPEAVGTRYGWSAR